ncbi:MAG: sulfotransferase family 2 domain-containing protein [Hyphomicrobiales bacterium]|nr:sulfotransferase family 2 domain-containing protein [Hyphomicrobiales bacterium]
MAGAHVRRVLRGLPRDANTPAMIVSHEHKFIFLKTRKTAGTSVELALSAICGPEDIITPVSERDEAMRQGRGPQNWDVNFNPWWKTQARRVGLFSKGRKHRGHYYNHMTSAEAKARLGDAVWRRYFKFAIARNPWDRQVSFYRWRTKTAETPMPFAEFMASERRARRNNHEVFMIGGALAVDALVRYEALANDLAAALAQAGVTQPLNLPRAKAVASSEKRPYREYYTGETRARVAAWYAPEIAAAGYEF